MAEPEQEANESKPRQGTSVNICGSTVTRLWPLSRARHPKQIWALSEGAERTLRQQTQQRLEGIAGLQTPLLICKKYHRFNWYTEANGYVAEQMRPSGCRFSGRAGRSRSEYTDNQ